MSVSSLDLYLASGMSLRGEQATVGSLTMICRKWTSAKIILPHTLGGKLSAQAVRLIETRAHLLEKSLGDRGVIDSGISRT
jgi:hypothetical protein